MGALIGLVLIAVVLLGLAGWATIGWVIRDAKRRDDHIAHAEQDMAALFDGSPQVVYAAPDTSGGLPTEKLVDGANRYGYRMISETGQLAARRVIFDRVSSDLSR